MLAKPITFCGQQVVLICDNKCDQAWGRNSRPKVLVDGRTIRDVEVFVADYEAQDAPADPGTYIGGDAKPTSPDQKLNKWCAQECERSCIVNPGEPFELPKWHFRKAA